MKKHKFLKPLLVLVIILALALPMSAVASPPTSAGDNGKIIISPPQGHVLSAEEFHAFELFTLTGINVIGETKEYVYSPTNDVVEFMKVSGMPEKYGATGLTGAEAAEAFRVWLQTETLDENDIIALAKDLTANAGSYNAISTNELDSNGRVVFDDLNYGYYLVLGGSLPVDPKNGNHSENVISRGMLVNIPDKDGKSTAEVDLKADSPTIDKEVWFHNPEGSNLAYDGVGAPVGGSDPGWQDWTDVSIGDTVHFKLESTIPDMTGYEKYTYIVHDTLSPGLTYDHSNSGMQIRLVKDGETPVTLYDESDYEVTAVSPDPNLTTGEYSGGTTIEITFIDFIELNNYEGWNVEITYKATLNEDAKVAANGNPNKVKLEYSNNPGWIDDGTKGPTGETPEDEVKVFTFDMEIFKYTGDIAGEHIALEYAEFQLVRVTADENSEDDIVYFIAYSEDGYDYRVVSPAERAADLELPPEDMKTTDILVSGTDGKIRIKGLDAGEYKLKETKAPLNYNLMLGWIEDIEITKDDSPQGYTLTVGGVLENAVNVQNNTGGQLPGTGGIGTYIFFGVGGLMAILLVAIFLLHRKKKALDILDAE